VKGLLKNLNFHYFEKQSALIVVFVGTGIEVDMRFAVDIVVLYFDWTKELQEEA
jgi:hypothetical protein